MPSETEKTVKPAGQLHCFFKRDDTKMGKSEKNFGLYFLGYLFTSELLL
jgi:hypothetical protein